MYNVKIRFFLLDLMSVLLLVYYTKRTACDLFSLPWVVVGRPQLPGVAHSSNCCIRNEVGIEYAALVIAVSWLRDEELQNR